MARIIVVHGDPSVLDAVRRLLSDLGHACECTSSAALAIDLAVKSSPDLIVLGADLPELNGLSLLEVIRCFLGTRCPPIVFAPNTAGEQFVAEISAALPSAFVFGSGAGPRTRSAA